MDDLNRLLCFAAGHRKPFDINVAAQYLELDPPAVQPLLNELTDQGLLKLISPAQGIYIHPHRPEPRKMRLTGKPEQLVVVPVTDPDEESLCDTVALYPGLAPEELVRYSGLGSPRAAQLLPVLIEKNRVEVHEGKLWLRGAFVDGYLMRSLVFHERDVRIWRYLHEHQPVRRSELTTAFPYITASTLYRCLERLSQLGAMQTVKARYYALGSEPPAPARQAKSEFDVQKRSQRMRAIWDAVHNVGGLKAAEIGRQTGMSQKTLYRYLLALVAEGYLFRSKKMFYALKPLPSRSTS